MESAQDFVINYKYDYDSNNHVSNPLSNSHESNSGMMLKEIEISHTFKERVPANNTKSNSKRFEVNSDMSNNELSSSKI